MFDPKGSYKVKVFNVFRVLFKLFPKRLSLAVKGYKWYIALGVSSAILLVLLEDNVFAAISDTDILIISSIFKLISNPSLLANLNLLLQSCLIAAILGVLYESKFKDNDVKTILRKCYFKNYDGKLFETISSLVDRNSVRVVREQFEIIIKVKQINIHTGELVLEVTQEYMLRNISDLNTGHYTKIRVAMDDNSKFRLLDLEVDNKVIDVTKYPMEKDGLIRYPHDVFIDKPVPVSKKYEYRMNFIDGHVFSMNVPTFISSVCIHENDLVKFSVYEYAVSENRNLIKKAKKSRLYDQKYFFDRWFVTGETMQIDWLCCKCNLCTRKDKNCKGNKLKDCRFKPNHELVLEY